MGAWGLGAFENDAALDWVAELESRGVEAIEAALSARTSGVDVDGASAAVAAAAVVAAARGHYGRSLPGDVAAWLGEHAVEVPVALSEGARRALDVVVTSELHELWAETDELSEWMDTIEEIRSGLPRE
jgi:hypothetical protein